MHDKFSSYLTLRILGPTISLCLLFYNRGSKKFFVTIDTLSRFIGYSIMFRRFRYPASIADELTLVEAENTNRSYKELLDLLRGSQWTCIFEVMVSDKRGYSFPYGALSVHADLSDDLTEVTLATSFYAFKDGDDADALEDLLKEIPAFLNLFRDGDKLELHHRLSREALVTSSHFDVLLGEFLEVAERLQVLLKKKNAKTQRKNWRRKDCLKNLMWVRRSTLQQL
jgi:hypothetical protein